MIKFIFILAVLLLFLAVLVFLALWLRAPRFTRTREWGPDVTQTEPGVFWKDGARYQPPVRTSNIGSL
jgi:hypothetical protein